MVSTDTLRVCNGVQAAQETKVSVMHMHAFPGGAWPLFLNVPTVIWQAYTDAPTFIWQACTDAHTFIWQARQCDSNMLRLWLAMQKQHICAGAYELAVPLQCI